MIIIHAVNDLPRLLQPKLERALGVLPVVVVTGARQTGKTTLVHHVGDPGRRRFVTLDDFDALEQARRSPLDLVEGRQPLTLDEVQRAPDVLLAIKRSVDRDRRPGRFLLTGSANLLLMRQVAESLAGRAVYLTLQPLTRGERKGQARCGLWSDLFSEREERWEDVLNGGDGAAEDWTQLARQGGYPTPALDLHDQESRALWFAGYVQTYLERDLRDLSAIGNLTDFRRLMEAVCHRLGNILNQTELGRDVGLPQPTVHRHLALLETSHQLVRLPAFAVNRTKRLIKSPKAYWTDVGLALDLAAIDAPGGAHLENLILCDLLAWRGSLPDGPRVSYWRTAAGDEVDFVIEWQNELLPVEVKASRRPRPGDAKGLHAFRAEHPKASRAGLLLHAGDATTWLTPDVLAVPWWRVL